MSRGVRRVPAWVPVLAAPVLAGVVLAPALAGGPAMAALRSTPDLGQAEGRCRANEPGPALLVDIAGLKDRRGRLKLEVYPANDRDFLADDNKLIEAGKVFRRVVAPVAGSGTPQLCVRLPAAGSYAVMVMHDRNDNHRFELSTDGVGFTGNPKLGLSRPRAAQARIVAGGGLTRTRVVMNYRTGLFSFGPVR